MERNFHCCTRTGRTTAKKIMEDGNITNTKDEKIPSTSLAGLFRERPAKLTTNGHDLAGEPSSPSDPPQTQYRPNPEDDKFRKRINPLRIHLGKRPFVDNSVQNNSTFKKKKPLLNKSGISPLPRNTVSRVPKIIPKRADRSLFHNVTHQPETTALAIDNEKDKPVPLLVPKHKSQLQQYKLLKKGKGEQVPQLKEYAQGLGLQPTVKFKCRKCCSMSFKTLAMLKEHQLVCRAQAKEPTLSPETVSQAVATSGLSRVTRKVYLCSACGTYYENWNLFLHMREVHNRYICLFCLGMFSKAEKLSSHLMHKHNVQEFSYDSKEEFCNVYNGTLYLMCCVCEEICGEQDDFFNHDCNNVKPKPVPVLVSKNAAKCNIKPTKICNISSTNGLQNNTKDMLPHTDEHKSEKGDMESPAFETISSVASCKEAPELISDTLNSNTTLDTESSVSTSDMTESVLESSSQNVKPVSPFSHTQQTHFTEDKDILLNGDERLEHSNGKYSPNNIDIPAVYEPPPVKSEVPTCISTEKEKEGGIKIKLSLNNANAPVIINSTVDPTIGIQNIYKPPPRVRRPPKRYEKECLTSDSTVQPKTPSIKMTICDKADSSFVKTTIYENYQDQTSFLNNNVECAAVSPEYKSDCAIKTTIYDNKIEDTNTLNKVPKLTVRVPKELLDKDSSSDYSSDSDVSDKLTVDVNNVFIEDKNESKDENVEVSISPHLETPPVIENKKEDLLIDKNKIINDADSIIDPIIQPKTEPSDDIDVEHKTEEHAVEEVPVIELTLDKAIDTYPLKDLLKVFLASTIYNCIYCNHVRKIAVNCEQLALHMVAQHRFSAIVNSITAEELLPETIMSKVKISAEELHSVFINLDSYDSVEKCENVQFDHLFECFQCYFKTAIHKDLYMHNRKMHQKTILLCVMCKSNFYSYSELLCHLCPGTYDSEYEIRFRCCLCSVDSIPSSFRLMVHLRKIHHTCDVCLEFCYSQVRLSNHVWKHKLHHLCYRCGIAYRNKADITKHLFWKHGTESVMCKKCLQKKWPHVYHFCSPPATFVCDECNLQFTKAVYLKVHKRFHSSEYPHVCTEVDCTEKFVSKKLLSKHLEEHRKKLFIEDLNESKTAVSAEPPSETTKEFPVIDLLGNEFTPKETGSTDVKVEAVVEQLSKKTKKKKLKDKDALLLDVILPELNLSESDSSEESDSAIKEIVSPKEEQNKEEPNEEKPSSTVNVTNTDELIAPLSKQEEPVKIEPKDEEKANEQKVLDIWNNFQKYQAKADAEVEKPKEKTPPLVPIRKHVCESDHDYCLIPTDINGDDEKINSDNKKSKRSSKKKHGGLSSSSSSSSDSDSSCSCGSNCSCSSSSGSSSSSSSGSDSSDESGCEQKKNRKLRKSLPSRRISNASNVDVMGNAETPILIPEKPEPLIAEADLETDESETDEEFYDKHPQQLANKLHAEKRNQLMLLASVAPSDGGSISGDISRPSTPVKDAVKVETQECKLPSSKKKSKKKKKSKSSKRRGPIKINIPKDIIVKSDRVEEFHPPLIPNKITISLQSNTVQLPESSQPMSSANSTCTSSTAERKRASKRRRVPNKFYGYSSDEDASPIVTALKPQQPPKLEWRKEDLPSPVSHKLKKEFPSSTIPSRIFNYTEPLRLIAPVPDPEPPRILMNSESMESSDSDSTDEGALEIYQPNTQNNPFPPPSYLNSGTSSLPYAFQRPPVRQAREGESVYCYCRCPYDEVSEMIGCDAEGCPIEWFHFECVGIMVPPKGKWYCPECRKNQSFSGYR